jgi:hypothetical protein
VFISAAIGERLPDDAFERTFCAFRIGHPKPEAVRIPEIELRQITMQMRRRPAPVQEAMSVASGLPRTWDEIAAGHLVIAQETLALGWWEAIVIDRKDDMFALRFRDYPKIPKFVRHRSAIALMSPPAE